MAAPHHNRIRFEGTIVGAERWSISCAYHPKTLGMPPITSYANMRQLAEAIGGLNSGRVFPVSWHQKLSTAVALTTIRVEYINQAGRLQQVAAYELPTAQAGVGSMKCPPQTSMVVSLRTGRPGRSYRGRMYLPSLAAGWSVHDAAILRGVEELIANKALSDETWNTLAQSWDEAQLFEFPMMVGQYVAIAFVQNSLRIRLAEDNPGLSHR